ncbi:MAG: hypothetical protein HYT97_06555 [Elusimicrobia bacterium]|nr:hypothetical protein [Elusimicrobiota bacterium]
MRREYDFSKAERGKFYREHAKLRIPIYLDDKLQDHIEKIAHKKHREVGEMVQHLIQKEMEIIEELV